MPVGTLANVKTLTPEHLKAAGAQMVLANTYHLHLQPGEDIVAAAGAAPFYGLVRANSHGFGGFQVFSLSEMRQISDQGVVFRSPHDGQIIELSPERAIAIQEALGADVIMAFDECPLPCEPGGSDPSDATHTTLVRALYCRQTTIGSGSLCHCSGGVYADLRRECAAAMLPYDLPGYAIGGVSVGEPNSAMHEIVAVTAPLLPAHKPRYLMGVGTHLEMLRAIAAGVDLFDCVIPTRLARHGCAIVQGQRWNLKNARFRRDYEPLIPPVPAIPAPPLAEPT